MNSGINSLVFPGQIFVSVFGSDGEIKVFDLVLLIDLLVLVVDLLDA